MALPLPQDVASESTGQTGVPGSRISLSLNAAEAIAAITGHFSSMDVVDGFAVSHDEESGLVVVEVRSHQAEDEWEAFMKSSWAWWMTQPSSWRDDVHLAVW